MTLVGVMLYSCILVYACAALVSNVVLIACMRPQKNGSHFRTTTIESTGLDSYLKMTPARTYFSNRIAPLMSSK